jgi:hypothetical protein
MGIKQECHSPLCLSLSSSLRNSSGQEPIETLVHMVLYIPRMESSTDCICSTVPWHGMYVNMGLVLPCLGCIYSVPKE